MATAATVYAAFNSLPASVRATAILAGGALRAIFDRTDVKDYDLFFRNREDYEDALSTLLGLVDYTDASGWRIEGELGSYGTAMLISPAGLQFNLIGFVFAEREEHLKLFDFRCCRIMLYQVGGVVYRHAEPGAIEDAIEKRLVVLSNNGEERTIRRIEHYINDYGYRLPDEEADARSYVARIPLAPRGGCGYE